MALIFKKASAMKDAEQSIVQEKEKHNLKLMQIIHDHDVATAELQEDYFMWFFSFFDFETGTWDEPSNPDFGSQVEGRNKKQMVSAMTSNEGTLQNNQARVKGSHQWNKFVFMANQKGQNLNADVDKALGESSRQLEAKALHTQAINSMEKAPNIEAQEKIIEDVLVKVKKLISEKNVDRMEGSLGKVQKKINKKKARLKEYKAKVKAEYGQKAETYKKKLDELKAKEKQRLAQKDQKVEEKKVKTKQSEDVQIKNLGIEKNKVIKNMVENSKSLQPALEKIFLMAKGDEDFENKLRNISLRKFTQRIMKNNPAISETVAKEQASSIVERQLDLFRQKHSVAAKK